MKYNFTMEFCIYEPLKEDHSEVMQNEFFFENVASRFRDTHGYEMPDNVRLAITKKKMIKDSNGFFVQSKSEENCTDELTMLDVTMTKKELDGIIDILSKVRNQM